MMNSHRGLSARALQHALIVVSAVMCVGAHAQNAICPTAPYGDSSNRCASTAFVQHGIGPIVGPLGGVLTGSLPNPGMAAGAASANIGTLGGVLTDTLPNPGMAAGAASANVGALGGDLTGTLPNPALQSILGGPGSVGSSSAVPVFSYDAKGRITAVSSAPIISLNAIFVNVASLVAANVDPSINSVTTLGYYTAGDGGGTTYLRVASAPSLPCSQTSNGGASFWDLPVRSTTNVRWCGAYGDSSHNDTTAFANAIASAAAFFGTVYIPATRGSGCYLATITIPDPQRGLTIKGDAAQVTGLGPGSCIRGTFLASSVTGVIGGINLSNLRFYDTSGGDVIKFVNAGYITLSHLMVSAANASSGCGISLQNTASYLLDNVQSYGSGGCALTIGDNGLSNSGPGVVNAGEYAIQGGTGIAAIQITGMPLGLQFNGVFCETHGPNAQACVMIDNSAASSSLNNVGQVTFIDYHGESNYNSTSNTFTDFLIGSVYQAGNVTIIGGNAWGQGNGTNYEQDFIRLVNGRMVTVQGVTTSKLTAANGYSRSMIRIESTYAGQYNFSSNINDGAPALYSDARTGSPLSSWVQDASNTGPRLDGYWLVANLPTCNTARKGLRSVVTDAASPTFGGSVTGSGSVTAPVMCNGTAWATF